MIIIIDMIMIIIITYCEGRLTSQPALTKSGKNSIRPCSAATYNGDVQR